MIISGDGLTPFTVRIKPDFKPVTKCALTWQQLANGNYVVVDRGARNDIYESEVSLYGEMAVIDTFIEAIEANRCSGSTNANRIMLSGFNEGETIFGAELLYSDVTIPATVVKLKEKDQKTWRGFGIKCTLRAIGVPSRKNDPPLPWMIPDPGYPDDPTKSKPPFLSVDVGYTGDSNIDLGMNDTYAGDYYFNDGKADQGFFEGKLTLDREGMEKMRTFLIDNRGQVITPGSDIGTTLNALPGIHHRLFGRRREHGAPFNLRVTEWSDLGKNGLAFWRIRLKLVEEV